MRKVATSFVAGVVCAILVQALVAVAETWSFGPSIAPLQAIFGSATFPIVTVVSLGIPIGLLYFTVAKLLAVRETGSLIVMAAPLGLLQLVSVVQSQGSKAYALFYALAFVGISIAGIMASARDTEAHAANAVSESA